ncbi:MAG: hypothetical protein CBE09_04700 [Rhizobiales bacterium TMED249]|nr:MAG: hypothetical protein CBE09_04700 [Rhizobiales bacterium TMED249]
MSTILFSVVIPTHNRGALALRAVESVLKSKTSSMEIIVVEDQTSSAEEWLLEHIKSGNIKYFCREDGNNGASETRNLGVELSSGKFILFLDDDDILLPEYLEYLPEVFQTNDVSWGFCDQISNGKSTKIRMSNSGFLQSQNFKKFKARLGAGFWIKRSLFLEMGGLDVNLTIDEDTDLCCRLLTRGYIPYYSRMVGINYSRNDGEIRLTNSTEKNVAMACYLRTLEKNFDPLKPVKGGRDFLLHRTHKFICETGNFSYLRALDKFQKSKIISVIFFLRVLKYCVKNFLHPSNPRN